MTVEHDRDCTVVRVCGGVDVATSRLLRDAHVLRVPRITGLDGVLALYPDVMSACATVAA